MDPEEGGLVQELFDECAKIRGRRCVDGVVCPATGRVGKKRMVVKGGRLGGCEHTSPVAFRGHEELHTSFGNVLMSRLRADQQGPTTVSVQQKAAGCVVYQGHLGLSNDDKVRAKLRH